MGGADFGLLPGIYVFTYEITTICLLRDYSFTISLYQTTDPT